MAIPLYRDKGEGDRTLNRCAVKFSKRFYFRLLLRMTPLQQRWEVRPVVRGTLEYLRVRNKQPHLPVLLCLGDSIFFFNQFRRARKCLICTRAEQRHFGRRPFKVCGRCSILDNTPSHETLNDLVGARCRGSADFWSVFLSLRLTIFRLLSSSD